MRWPKFKKFWTKTEEELPVDESEKQEEQSKDEIDLGDIHFGEELDPEARAKTFAKKKIFCVFPCFFVANILRFGWSEHQSGYHFFGKAP